MPDFLKLEYIRLLYCQGSGHISPGIRIRTYIAKDQDPDISRQGSGHISPGIWIRTYIAKETDPDISRQGSGNIARDLDPDIYC